MYEALFPYLLGILMAAVTWYPARALAAEAQRRFFTAVIAVVILGFVGFPLEQGDLTGLGAEALAAAALLALLLASLRIPALLPVVWFGHGAWDLAYLLGAVPVHKPLWVVQLCVPYDWLLALYLSTRVGGWKPSASRGG